MARRDLEGAYARLRGLKESSFTNQPYLSRVFGDDYGLILRTFRANVEDPFDGFDLGPHCFWHHDDVRNTYNRSAVVSKINQLISYLEMVHRASDRIEEIGSVFNLIQDAELKSSCTEDSTDCFWLNCNIIDVVTNKPQGHQNGNNTVDFAWRLQQIRVQTAVLPFAARMG